MNQQEKLSPLFLPTDYKSVHIYLPLHKDDLLESDEVKKKTLSITKNFLSLEYLKKHFSSLFVSHSMPLYCDTLAT